MRIVFMGTPDFAACTLQAVYEAGHEVVLAVTQPDRPKGRGGKVSMSEVKQYAAEKDIAVYQPERIRDAAAVEELRRYAPELIVVAAFGQILPKEILEMPEYGCINVHASLLPRLRGASPIQTAILEGDSETGVTIQQMGEGLDTGDIISQRSIEIESDDTGGSLFDKLAKLGAELTVDTIAAIAEGRAQAVPQDEERATYAAKIDKKMGHIDYSRPAAEICRMIRALNPWPSAYTYIDGKIMKVWKARAGEDVKDEAGCVSEVTKDYVRVACSEGSLVLEEVQIEGKKRMTVHDLLLGYRIEKGTVLT